ncbi:MAG: hypothetical protein LBU34_00805 [Planctomycetaceae bacterium]|jgi:tetratricopeptide (TPR) repeat protein|nr:hypothetical protein [Planctomycetaceae bacterium]
MNYKKTIMFAATLFIALCLTGCGNSGNNESTDDFQKRVWSSANTNQSSNSLQPSNKQKTPDEKELNEIVKTQIWKEFVSDSPFEIADVTVNWIEKTAQSCSGDFSVNLRAKENLYEDISVKDGLEKLGIKNLYEGELKQAEEKVYKLPEPYKTNLRNEYPQDQLNRFHFVNVKRAKGSADKAGGIVVLNRYGNTWNVSVQFKTSPSVGSCYPESGLNDSVKKLDNPETKKAVEDIIQKRKDYVNKVDTTINDLNKKFENALTSQKENFLKLCKPNVKYEGSWKYKDTGGSVVVLFGNYENADKTIINGVYYSPDYPQFKRKFTVSVNTKEVAEYPATGTLEDSRSFKKDNSFPDYRNEAIKFKMMDTLMSRDRDKVRIKFSNNKLVFDVWSSGWGNVQFDF